MAFATATRQLRTVRVAVNWGMPSSDKNAQPGAITLNPTLQTKHLAISHWMNDCPDEGIESSQLNMSMAQLSHLEIIPPLFEGPGGTTTVPTLIAVRSHLPLSSSQFNQETYSVVDRWEIREATQSLHPAFEHLSSRINSTGSSTGTAFFLKKVEGFTINKVVLAVQPISHSKVLCFGYEDGSWEYRDRSSLTANFAGGNLERFNYLTQIGFSYPEDERSKSSNHVHPVLQRSGFHSPPTSSEISEPPIRRNW